MTWENFGISKRNQRWLRPGQRSIDAFCDVLDKMTVTMDELPGEEPLPDFDAAKDFYANYEPKEVLGR